MHTNIEIMKRYGAGLIPPRKQGLRRLSSSIIITSGPTQHCLSRVPVAMNRLAESHNEREVSATTPKTRVVRFVACSRRVSAFLPLGAGRQSTNDDVKKQALSSRWFSPHTRSCGGFLHRVLLVHQTCSLPRTPLKSSMGSGNTMVEFFSAAMDVSVCR